MLIEAKSKPHDIAIYTGGSVTRMHSESNKVGRSTHNDSDASEALSPHIKGDRCNPTRSVVTSLPEGHGGHTCHDSHSLKSLKKKKSMKVATAVVLWLSSK